MDIEQMVERVLKNQFAMMRVMQEAASGRVGATTLTELGLAIGRTNTMLEAVAASRPVDWNRVSFQEDQPNQS
jgi:hypothetical protein